MTKRNGKLLTLITDLENERIVLANLKSDRETADIRLEILTRKAGTLEATVAQTVCVELATNGAPRYTSDKTRSTAVTNSLAQHDGFIRTVKRINRVKRKLIEYDKELATLDAKIKSKEAIIAIHKI